MIFHLVLFLMLWETTRSQQLCSRDGRCHDDPPQQQELFPPLSSNYQTNTCPAGDCNGSGRLQHHFDDVSEGNSVGCFNRDTGYTRDNTFLRCFSGALCSSNRIVESIFFSVEYLNGPGTLALTLELRKGDSNGCSTAMTVADLFVSAPIVATETLALAPPATDRVWTVPLQTPVPLSPSESLLVSLTAPDLEGLGEFYLGDSNDIDQCGPSYLQSNECGIDPTPTSNIGNFANVSYILGVETTVAPTNAPSSLPSAAPSPTPTEPPIPPPSPIQPPGSPVPAPPAFCLSGRNRVRVWGCEEPVSVADVRVGDWVWTTGGSGFSRIYSLAHYHPQRVTTFVQLYTTGNHVVEVTAQHLVYVVQQGDFWPAGRVRVGDELLLWKRDDSDYYHNSTLQNAATTVTRIDTVQRRGLYAPLTESGTLLVLLGDAGGGVLVSTYVDFWEGRLPHPHTWVRALIAPIQYICTIWPGWCAAETHDVVHGYSNLLGWGIRFLAGENGVPANLLLHLPTVVIGAVAVMGWGTLRKRTKVVADFCSTPRCC